MASLYAIDRTIEDVIERGFSVDEETGELIASFDDLEQLEAAYGDKLEACGVWVKNQQALADAMKSEEDNLRKRRKMVENAVERMKSYMLGSMHGKFVSPKVQIAPRKSSRVVIDDPDAVPTEFEKVTTTYTVDKTAVRKALKEGEEVPGCRIEERLTLSVK